jgi:hypothetical protein
VTTAPPTPGEQWTFQALGPALDELEAQPPSPEHLLWLRIWTVLGLMHSLDDQAKERITKGPYYGLRAASDDGLTLAALTMVRDLAHHEGHRVQPALVHRGMELLAAVEGGLVPLTVSAVGDGGLVDLEVTAPSVLWRPTPSCHHGPGRGRECTTGTSTTSGALRDGASWSRSGPPSASWRVSSSRRTAGNIVTAVGGPSGRGGRRPWERRDRCARDAQ